MLYCVIVLICPSETCGALTARLIAPQTCHHKTNQEVARILTTMGENLGREQQREACQIPHPNEKFFRRHKRKLALETRCLIGPPTFSSVVGK